MNPSKLKTFWGQIVTDGNDAESDLSLSVAEGNIGADVLDPDQVIPGDIIININDQVSVSNESFQVQLPILLVAVLR